MTDSVGRSGVDVECTLMFKPEPADCTVGLGIAGLGFATAPRSEVPGDAGSRGCWIGKVGAVAFVSLAIPSSELGITIPVPVRAGAGAGGFGLEAVSRRGGFTFGTAGAAASSGAAVSFEVSETTDFVDSVGAGAATRVGLAGVGRVEGVAASVGIAGVTAGVEFGMVAPKSASGAGETCAEDFSIGESFTEILMTSRTKRISSVTAILFLSIPASLDAGLGFTRGPSGASENGAAGTTGAGASLTETEEGAATFPSGRGGAATSRGCTFFNENRMGVFPQSRARWVGLFLAVISFVMGRFLSIQIVKAEQWQCYGTVSPSSKRL